MGWRSGICVAIGEGEDTCGTEDQTWRRKSDREVTAWMLGFVLLQSLQVPRDIK